VLTPFAATDCIFSDDENDSLQTGETVCGISSFSVNICAMARQEKFTKKQKTQKTLTIFCFRQFFILFLLNVNNQNPTIHGVSWHTYGMSSKS